MTEQRRSLIVGQAPARSARDDQRPWDSASGKRLAKMMGTTHGQLLNTFDTCNLNTQLHGTKGKWDVFDLPEARGMAAYLARSILWQYDVVLLCGQQVAKCFNLPAPAHDILHAAHPLMPELIVTTSIYTIPHPGGTNLWWNKAHNRMAGEAYARRAWQHATRARRVAQDALVAPVLTDPMGHHAHRTATL